MTIKVIIKQFAYHTNGLHLGCEVGIGLGIEKSRKKKLYAEVGIESRSQKNRNARVGVESQSRKTQNPAVGVEKKLERRRRIRKN